MLVGGLDEAGFQQLGAFRVVRMLARVSEAAEVHLGRTFGDALWTAVTEHELDGAIDCFHWFQYFDASLASRWPDPVWASEPVFETVSHANGSRHLVMGPSPFDSLYSVKAAAAHFGMTLRSIPITHVDGTKSVFRWP
jgi:hypothetical protein